MPVINVNVTANTTQIPLQSGVTPGVWQFGLVPLGSTAVTGVIQSAVSATNAAMLTGLELGQTYNFFARRLSADDQVIGSAVFAELTVTANPAAPTVDVPLSISIAAA